MTRVPTDYLIGMRLRSCKEGLEGLKTSNYFLYPHSHFFLLILGPPSLYTILELATYPASSPFPLLLSFPFPFSSAECARDHTPQPPFPPTNRTPPPHITDKLKGRQQRREGEPLYSGAEQSACRQNWK